MASCEKCWDEARKRYCSDPRKAIIDHYYIVMKEVQDSGYHCTPKEKAGNFWDEKNQCDTRIAESQTEPNNKGE